ATSVCSLVWIWFHRRQSAVDTAWPRSEAFLKTQTGIALFSTFSLLAVVDVRVFLDPWTGSALAESIGGVIGVSAVALPVIAYARIRVVELERLSANQFGAGLLALGSLLVCVVSRFAGDGWIAYRALTLTLNAAAWLMLAIRWIALNAGKSQTGERIEPRDLRSRLVAAVAHIGDQSVSAPRPVGSGELSAENWIATLTLMTGAMTLRGVFSPGEPWWTAGFSISICLVFVGLSLISRRRGYIYLAAAAINYATSRLHLWADPDLRVFETVFLQVNTI